MSSDYKNFLRGIRQSVVQATATPHGANDQERWYFQSTRERLLEQIDAVLENPWRLGITHNDGERVGPVVIQSVQQSTPAARAGLSPGEKIVAMNGWPLSESQQPFRYMIANADSREIELSIRGDSGVRQVTVRLTR